MDMIACDNPNCELEWFHLSCVGLTEEEVPEGEWFCDDCRPQKEKQQKPKQKQKAGKGKGSKSQGKKKSRKVPHKSQDTATSTWTYTPETLTQDSTLIFTEGIKSLYDHIAAEVDDDFAADITKMDKTLETFKDDADLQVMVQSFLRGIWDVVSPLQRPTPKAHDDLNLHFTQLRLSDDIQTMFDQILSHLCVNLVKRNFVLQFLLDAVLKETLKRISSLSTDLSGSQPKCKELSKSEEMALRYVAGYVVRGVHRNLKKSKDPDHQQAAFTFESECHSGEDCFESESLLSYTKRWVQLKDRGGLHKVSDKMYNVFCEMESTIQPYFTVENANLVKTISKAKITKMLMSNYSVLSAWDLATSDIDSDTLKETLFSNIVNHFTGLKMRSFATVYMFVHKSRNLATARNNDGP